MKNQDQDKDMDMEMEMDSEEEHQVKHSRKRNGWRLRMAALLASLPLLLLMNL